jgi:hypothetical protein
MSDPMYTPFGCIEILRKADRRRMKTEQAESVGTGVEVSVYVIASAWNLEAAKEILFDLGFFAMGEHGDEYVIRCQPGGTPEEAQWRVIEGLMSIEGLLPYDVRLGELDLDESPGDQETRLEAFVDSLPEELARDWIEKVSALPIQPS